MFVRVKTRPNGKRSVQICESYRRSDKVHQKIVRHVGQAESDKEEESLRKLANGIIAEMENDRQPVLPLFSPEKFYDSELKKKSPSKKSIGDIMSLREEQRIIMGIGDVFGKLYRDLSFNTIIKGTYKDAQWNSILKSCVLARLANPSSKRETASFLEQDYGIKIPLEKIYRLMDHVSNHEDEIKSKIVESTLLLFGNKLNVLFFDVTTLYFESTESDSLRDFGFSKDNKFKEVQVVLSLITTDYGMPVGYELFPGNTFEGNTLFKSIENIRDKYRVEELTVVADRGMFSEKNLFALDNMGINYIVGAKLKTLTKLIKNTILEDADYKACSVLGKFHWLKELEYKKRRLITGYSKERSKKDAQDRQRLIDRLMTKVKNGAINIKDIIPNTGTKKYLNVQNEKASINEDKINSDADWDGIYGIITNIKKTNATKLVEKYRGLWPIEESFRVNKHDLKMRPIFHWSPSRVKAHIAICFMSYTLARQAVYRVQTQTDLKKMSFPKLRNELLHAQSSLMRDIDKRTKYLIPSNVTVNQRKIYRAFGLTRKNIPEQLVPD